MNTIESIDDRKIEIDPWSSNRDIFSNNVHIIRKHKNNLRSILKECRCNRNKIDSRLEDKINTLLHKYDIKREGFWW